MAQDNKKNTRSGRHSVPKRKGPLKKILLVVGGIVLAGGLAGVGLFTYYASSAPALPESALTSDNSTKFYDAKGNLISRTGAQNRDYVKSSDIPDNLKKAVVSIEDRRFYKDHGVDPVRIVEAAFANLTGSSSLGLQGGSTLTQQLVKLSVFSTAASDQTLKRKAQEAWLAIQVERKYSKDQILEFYMNKVYMGNGVYGMQTAAEYYYGKTLDKLNLSQLALIAGMPQSPTNYSPYKYPQYATQRRNNVLQAMVKNKAITQAQADEAKTVNVQTGLAKTHSQLNTSEATSKYIDSYLKETISELHEKGYKNTSGLKVYTNLKMSAQKKMYKTANSSDTIVYPSNKFQLGATLINVNNGKVVAMQGNRKNKISFGLNRAVQTDRSSGSTAKPLMDYAPAIQYLNYPTYQPVKDTPFVYPGTDKSLNDFDNQYQGTITMRKALIESRNIPAIRTLQNVGVSQAQTFLEGLGMKFSKPLDLQNGIGLYISSEQEAAAYAAFANGGTYYEPYLINKVVETNGKTKKFSSKGKQAMSPATAFMITNMLKGVMDSSNGSGTAAKISGLYEAGKTGTTQYPDNYINKVPSNSAMDSWFTGYTRHYALSVWTGYDQQFKANHYITQEQTKIAQQYYRDVMATVSLTKTNIDWQQPADVTAVKKNGQTEYAVAGHEITVTDNSSATAASNATTTAGSGSTATEPNNNNSSSQSTTNTSNTRNNTVSSYSSRVTQQPSTSNSTKSNTNSADNSNDDSNDDNNSDDNNSKSNDTTDNDKNDDNNNDSDTNTKANKADDN